jgi:hypothetical protein
MFVILHGVASNPQYAPRSIGHSKFTPLPTLVVGLDNFVDEMQLKKRIHDRSAGVKIDSF